MKKVNLKAFQDKRLGKKSKKAKGGSVILPHQYDLTVSVTAMDDGSTCGDPVTSADDFL